VKDLGNRRSRVPGRPRGGDGRSGVCGLVRILAAGEPN